MISVNTYNTLDIDYRRLDNILVEIQNMINRFGPEAEVRLTSDGYSDRDYPFIFIKREENDKEYQKRINEENFIKDQRRKQYEILKKEFE